MKKTFFAMAAAVAAIFGFTSCEGGIDIGEIVDPEILGHVTIVASDVQGDQACAEGDTVQLKSALCNVQVTLDGGVTIDAGAVMVASATNLVSDGATNIDFPLCGINLRDTVAKSYTISCPVSDFEFFRYLNEEGWTNLITGNVVELGNVMALAFSEEAYYVAYSGTIDISQFSAVGTLVKGEMKDVKAFYVTRTQLEALWAMSEAEREALSPATYFASATFNGEISSRRANMEAVLDAIDQL